MACCAVRRPYHPVQVHRLPLHHPWESRAETYSAAWACRDWVRLGDLVVELYGVVETWVVGVEHWVPPNLAGAGLSQEVGVEGSELVAGGLESEGPGYLHVEVEDLAGRGSLRRIPAESLGVAVVEMRFFRAALSASLVLDHSSAAIVAQAAVEAAFSTLIAQILMVQVPHERSA